MRLNNPSVERRVERIARIADSPPDKPALGPCSAKLLHELDVVDQRRDRPLVPAPVVIGERQWSDCSNFG